jgi:ABC-2 type transporter
MTSLGVAIAVVARKIAQAVMIMLLILQPMLFLSGAWNPPEAMNPWLRKLSIISPMGIFIHFGYGVLLKGNGLSFVLWDIVGIVVVGASLFALSLWWFRRSLAGYVRTSLGSVNHSRQLVALASWADDCLGSFAARSASAAASGRTVLMNI